MEDYDRNIHHNPDAMAWAKFFVETTKSMGREVFCDESYMVGWFANAMMAMHDSIKPYEAADEIERLREALNADSQTIRLHLGEMTQQEMRTVKAAFAWVLSRSALQQKESE